MLLGPHPLNVELRAQVDILWPVGYDGPTVSCISEVSLGHSYAHLLLQCVAALVPEQKG